MQNIKTAPNQKVVVIHKVHGKGGRILDIESNREAMHQLSSSAYVLYMHFILSLPGYTEALSLQHLSETTSLRERTYYKAINELIEKQYLVKEHHQKFKEYYAFYETPNLYSLTAEDYIDKFLRPYEELPPNKTLIELSKDIIDPPIEYNSLIDEKIQSLTYDDFLQTLYWKSIAAFKRKQMDYKCELCGSTKDLNVHHKTYVNHGSEHNSQVIKNDLMLLCGECHHGIHNKNTTK